MPRRKDEPSSHDAGGRTAYLVLPVRWSTAPSSSPAGSSSSGEPLGGWGGACDMARGRPWPARVSRRLPFESAGRGSREAGGFLPWARVRRYVPCVWHRALALARFAQLRSLPCLRQVVVRGRASSLTPAEVPLRATASRMRYPRRLSLVREGMWAPRLRRPPRGLALSVVKGAARGQAREPGLVGRAQCDREAPGSAEARSREPVPCVDAAWRGRYECRESPVV